jgi:hypothetical protein
MEPVLQNGSRKRRPWTAQDQTTAEVAAACGVSLREIGRTLEYSDVAVRNHLIAAAAENARNRRRLYYQNNPEKIREYRRLYHEANSGRISEKNRIYYESNCQRLRNRNRLYYQANLDKERKRARLWQFANPDKVRENNRRWRKSNPDQLREAGRRHYENNRRRVLERNRFWQQNNKDVLRELARRRAALHRAARRQALHPVTRAQIDARFALWGNRCAFCGVDATHQRNHGRQRLTVEHVLALTKGGLDEAANIIPACTACNSSKNNSPIEDWYRQQPWFMDARWRKIQRHCPAAVVGQLPLALTA